MKPLISVIIPIRNSEKTIVNCLQSLTLQGYPNFELIVVDNNSDDLSLDLVKKFSQQSEIKIQIFFENRVGRAYSRNLGIEKAKGDLIAMIDSDCVAPPDWLEKISGPIIKKNEKIVMGSESSEFDNYFSNYIQIANEELVEKSLLEGKYVTHLDTKNICFHREVFNDKKFDVDIKNCEDFEFYLQIRDSHKILFRPDIKVKHRHRINGKGWFSKQFDRGFETYKIYKKYSNINHPMLESFSILNFLKSPLFLIKTLFLAPKKFYFTLVSEFGWRLGILYSIVKN